MKRHKTAIFALFIGLFSILLWVACKADTQETQQKSVLDSFMLVQVLTVFLLTY